MRGEAHFGACYSPARMVSAAGRNAVVMHRVRPARL